MKTAIIGIGGVGGYYGGKLAVRYASAADHAVFFVARGIHLESIRKKGLEVITKEEGDFVAEPTLATDSPKELGPLDVIIFCVKGYDLEEAALMTRENIHPDTVVISLLNGVDNADRLQKILHQGHILNGCVYISSRIAAPGKIEQVGGPRLLIFGPERGPTDHFRDIESLLGEAGIKARLSENIATEVWTKFVFMGPLAGITSMKREPFGAVMENDADRSVVEGLMREVVSIAKAQGLTLPDDVIQKSLDLAAGFPYETKSSMQLDFEKGKRTELEAFIGYVVKSGQRLGIPTPLHETVYSTLKS